MPLDHKLLPPNVLRYMSTQEQKRLGYVSPEKVKAKSSAARERELHDQVANLLRLRGVRYLGHSRMDRKTSRRKGEPDFIFSHRSPKLDDIAEPCAIELKTDSGELSEEQRLCIADMRQDGWEVLIARNLEDVKAWLDSL